jgi:hypothetical protein
MEYNSLNAPSSSQSNPQRSNRPAGSVRQPVSCEPCRQRKIKCSRTCPPCVTCRRRGCTDICVYKKTRDDAPSIATTGANEELLNRISNLEALLRKYTGAQIPNSAGDGQLTGPMLSPPMDFNGPVEPSPVSGSFASESPSQMSYSSEPTAARRLGVLTTSQNGNVRYEAQSSQWTSVLANTGLSNMTSTLEDYEDSGVGSGFPFTSSPPPSVDELLALLPPTQQCGYLKDTYFAVFSPVSHIILHL